MNNDSDALPHFMINSPHAARTLFHDGYKIKLGICIERQPIKYFNQDFEIKFRNFRENWARRTNNSLALLDSTTNEVSIPLQLTSEDHKTTDTFDLESLLEQERLFIKRLSTDSTAEKDSTRKVIQTSDVDNKNTKNLSRLPEERLFLLIKQKIDSDWVFPIFDYYPELSLRQSLHDFCQNNILNNSLYFLGFAPICHIKTRDRDNNKDSKIFYFRARLIKNNQINISSLVNDHAWVSRRELSSFIDLIKYKRIYQSLPLSWVDF